MNIRLDEAVNQRYRDMAEGKTPKAENTDILWITPHRLGLLFGVSLIITAIFN